MSSKRLHYDSALKWKVIVNIEKHETEQLGVYLILVKQIFVAGGTTTIPHILAKQQNALPDLRKEGTQR